MKTWMFSAMLALAPTVSFAEVGTEQLPVNEKSRVELINDIEATRTALLPQAEPLPQVTVRYQPRLNDLKASIVAAKTPAQFAKAKQDFADWKAVVQQELYSAEPRPVSGGGPFPAYSVRSNEEINFAAALQRRLGVHRVETEATELREVSRSAAWGHYFDYQTPAPAAASPDAVRVEAPLAANDPARYAKIRALLLSRGVSSKIVDTAIAEGIRQKVDPMIVLSVINQESNFRKNAYNKGSGCTGLMQLDPATAADMGVHGNLYDPLANIKAGVKYMNWIANSFFKMNLDMSDLAKVPAEKLKIVLASYNWGIGNVQKSLRKYGTAALDRVAPKETRNYIAEIPSRIYSWFASF